MGFVKMRRLFVILFFLQFVAVGFSAEGGAELPTVGSLLALAPRIDLDEKDVKSFQVSGSFNMGGMKLQFMVLGRKPHQTALRIFDMRDSTPVLIGATNGFALYDPLASEMIMGNSVPYFSLKMEKPAEGENGNGKACGG